MRNVATAKNWLVLFGLLILAIVGSHLVFEKPIVEVLTATANVLGGQPATGVLVFLGLSIDVLLPIPSSVLSVWAVIALGFFGGFLAIWLGMCMSCLLGYWIGFGSGSWLKGHFFKAEDLQAARSFARRHGVTSIVLMRAVPVLAEASVVAAGIAKMPFKQFVVISALSNAGIALAYAGIGAYANANASFALAFFASIALPLVAIVCYRGWLLVSKREAVLPEENLESLNRTLTPQFNVNFRFPLCFTNKVFDPANTCLIDQLNPQRVVNNPRALFFVDAGVAESQANLQQSIVTYCAQHKIDWCDVIHILPGGEAAKTQQHINSMHQHMLDAELDRQSCVIAIGGGAVLDAVGYAAATFHRGIRLLRMPTTVLAQNDAGIGVKNGINAQGMKNLFGSFAVPHAIINDRQFLHTLSARDYRSGFAEAIKVALIRDAGFFHWIKENVEGLNQRDEHAAHHLISRCAELHLNQICNGGDPFEMGSARPLDYGHWSAHKLESLTKHALSHGEAVAIGMALDALYAAEVGILKIEHAETVINVIKSVGFNVWHESLLWTTNGGEGDDKGESAVLRGLEEFRQHLGGALCITLLTDIGETIEVNEIDGEALLRARDKLASYTETASG